MKLTENTVAGPRFSIAASRRLFDGHARANEKECETNLVSTAETEVTSGGRNRSLKKIDCTWGETGKIGKIPSREEALWPYVPYGMKST